MRVASPPARRRILVDLAVAAAALVAVLAVLEAVARRALPAVSGKEDNIIAGYTEHDPILGWRKRPGVRATYRRREYTAEIAVNDRGLRDRDRPYDPPPDTFRLLALGDSFVEAYTVPVEEGVSRRLEDRLRRPGCDVDVVNGGTSGYSTDQEYLFYVDEGRRYRPRVVVLFFYFNDVYFNGVEDYFGRPKPLLFFLWDPRGCISNLPVPPPKARPPRDDPPPPAPRSALFAWTRARLQTGAPRAYDALARLGLWEPLDIAPLDPQMLVYKTGVVGEVKRPWEKTTHILEALAREVAADGAKLLVAYVPSAFEVSDREWDLTRRRYGLSEGEWDRDLVRRRLVEIGAATGFPVLDLTPALKRAKGPVRNPYFVYDPHWNALGHDVAALQVAAFLRAQGWTGECAVRSALAPDATRSAAAP